MLSSASSAATLLTNAGRKCGQSALGLEFIRWRRKPLSLPMAKSKMNRVRERKIQDPEERAELMRLHNNYHLQMRSLMQYFREEAKRVEKISTADHFFLTPEQEEAEFQQCLKENEAWNAKVAAERDVRLQKERQERAALIMDRIEKAKEREEERMEKIEAIVRREKELSKTFITRENLDEAIKTAMANPVDYNFSIDLKGNIYRGRTTLPGDTPKAEESKAAVAQN